MQLSHARPIRDTVDIKKQADGYKRGYHKDKAIKLIHELAKRQMSKLFTAEQMVEYQDHALGWRMKTVYDSIGNSRDSFQSEEQIKNLKQIMLNAGTIMGWYEDQSRDERIEIVKYEQSLYKSHTPLAAYDLLKPKVQYSQGQTTIFGNLCGDNSFGPRSVEHEQKEIEKAIKIMEKQCPLINPFDGPNTLSDEEEEMYKYIKAKTPKDEFGLLHKPDVLSGSIYSGTRLEELIRMVDDEPNLICEECDAQWYNRTNEERLETWNNCPSCTNLSEEYQSMFQEKEAKEVQSEQVHEVVPLIPLLAVCETIPEGKENDDSDDITTSDEEDVQTLNEEAQQNRRYPTTVEYEINMLKGLLDQTPKVQGCTSANAADCQHCINSKSTNWHGMHFISSNGGSLFAN